MQAAHGLWFGVAHSWGGGEGEATPPPRIGVCPCDWRPATGEWRLTTAGAAPVANAPTSACTKAVRRQGESGTRCVFALTNRRAESRDRQVVQRHAAGVNGFLATR
jgi:hypothetical protein